MTHHGCLDPLSPSTWSGFRPQCEQTCELTWIVRPKHAHAVSVQLVHYLPQPRNASRLRLDQLELVAIVHPDVGVYAEATRVRQAPTLKRAIQHSHVGQSNAESMPLYCSFRLSRYRATV